MRVSAAAKRPNSADTLAALMREGTVDKSADAFRTISEVASEIDIPKHVLRFWEVKFPQIRPMKRGGGRRYYRPQDMELLRGIRHLLHAEGYTIKGVQKILREYGIDHVKQLSRAASADERKPGRGKARGADAPAAELRRAKGAKARARAPRETPSGAPSAAEKPDAPDLRARILASIGELRACRLVLLGKPVPAPQGSRLPNGKA